MAPSGCSTVDMTGQSVAAEGLGGAFGCVWSNGFDSLRFVVSP